MKLKNKILLALVFEGFLREHDKRALRRDSMTIVVNDSMCEVTKNIVRDFNIMSDRQFRSKYNCSKVKYNKRVQKYGDPYMKSPLARLDRFLSKLHIKKR